MERDIDMAVVSDGKLYSKNDLVKLECEDCKGCSSCCEDMGTSILLDPFDLFQLCKATNKTFYELLQESVDFIVQEQVIIPYIRMEGNKASCFYLSKEGRCKIHEYRPGFCRLFPLGRIYENGTFSYFLQKMECRKGGRSKLKIKKWIGIESITEYEQFICDWHYLVKEIGQDASKNGEEWTKEKNIKLLKLFYETPYLQEKSFYQQYEQRRKEW